MRSPPATHRFIARGLVRAFELPRLVGVGVVATLLTIALTLLWSTGGVASPWTHLVYLPILLASVPFGIAGAVVVAGVAAASAGGMLLAGVGDGGSWDWLVLATSYVGVAAVTGLLQRGVQEMYRQAAVEQFEHEMTLLDLTDDALDSEHVRGKIVVILEERRFRPVYQPLYSLHDGSLVAVEALTRFAGDESVSPAVWFGRAARADLGADLELAAIDLALEESRELPGHVALSVNCSPPTAADPRLLGLLDRAPDRLIYVEVTEHLIVEDYGTLLEGVRRLRRRGVQIAVDDVIAGFASLRHIARLRPDIIKLDVSVSHNLHHDPIRRALADALVRFAHRTGSRLVAEGIERRPDLAVWTDLEADLAQGFLLGRPTTLPVDETCSIIAEGSVR